MGEVIRLPLRRVDRRVNHPSPPTWPYLPGLRLVKR